MKSSFALNHMKKRVIALVMAILLAFTPMYSSVGGDGGVKADGITYNVAFTFTPSYEKDGEGNWQLCGDIEARTVKCVPVITDVNVKICINNQTSDLEISGNSLKQGGEIVASSYPAIEYSIYKIYTGKNYEVNQSIWLEDGKKKTIKVGEIIVEASADSISDAKWTDTTKNSMAVSGVEEDKSAESSVDTTKVGVIKYGYAVAKKKSSDDNDNVGYETDYCKYSAETEISWGYSMPGDEEIKSEDFDDGYYVGFVAYFADTDATEPISDECVKSLGEILIDKNAPIINKCTVFVGEEDCGTDQYITASGNVLGTIKAEVSDDYIDTVKLVKKKLTTDGTEENTYVTVGEFEAENGVYSLGLRDSMDKDFDYYVCATDKKGNSTYSRALPRLFVVASDRCEVSNVIWTDNAGSDPIITNTQKGFLFNLETYKEVKSVNIVKGEDTLSVITPEGSGTSKTSGYYEYTCTGTLPGDATSAENYDFKYLKIQVVYSDDTTATKDLDLTEMFYDNTAPIVDYGHCKAYFTSSDDTTSDVVKWIGKNTTVGEDRIVVYSEEDNNVTIKGITITSGQGKDAEAYVESDLVNTDDSLIKAEVSGENILTLDEGGSSTKKTGALSLSESESAAGTEISWTVADAAGNTNNDKVKAYVDLTAPTISFASLTVNNASQSVQSGGDTMYAFGDSSLGVNVSDELSGVSKVEFNVVKAGNTDAEKKEYSKDEIDENGQLTVKLSDIIGSAEEEAEYKITATAYDAAGNTASADISVIYDNKAPEISEITLVRKGVADNTWEEVPEGEIDNNVYYINNTADKSNSDTYAYAYKVVIKDIKVNSKQNEINDGTTPRDDVIKIIDDSSVVTADGCTVEQATDSTGKEISGKYVCYINVDKTKLNSTSPSSFTISVTDAAGHTTSSSDSNLTVTSLQAVDTSITIKDIKVLEVTEDSDPKDVTNDSDTLANGTNKTYKIQATIEGPSKFSSINLMSGDKTVAESEKDDEKGFGENLGVNKRYSTTVTFDVPDADGLKAKVALYSSLKIAVTYVDAVTETSGEIVTLLYDTNPPVVTFGATDGERNGLSDSSDGSKNWVKSAIVGINVKSGESTDVKESDLKNVTYTVTGGSETSMTPETDNATVAEESVTLSESSSSINGTTITVSAEDKAGNKTVDADNNNAEYYSKTYYIDADAPVISSFTVGGKTSTDTDINLNGDPEISVKVTDNLTLQNVTITVTKDGKEAAKDVALLATPLEKENLSQEFTKTLSEILDSAAANGNYTITVTATDKAGNTTKSSGLSFKLDNTAPVITVISTARDGAGEEVTVDGKTKTWAKEVTLNVTVSSADDTDVQSDIVKATYTLNDGKTAGVATGFTTINGTTATTEINVPVSQKTTGTTVTIYAKDAAGNDITETYTYYVDATNPEIKNLKVAGSTAANQNLKDDPEISVDVSDNLSIREAKISVAYGGEDPASITVVSDEEGNGISEKDIKKNLSDFFKNAKDGDYTVTVTVTDKAGNTTTSDELSFRLDNSTPVITVTPTAKDGTGAEVKVTGSEADAKWVNSVNLDIAYSSADADEDEEQSNLTAASYQFGDSKEVSVPTNDSSTVTKKGVAVPESTSTSGTKAVLRASDESQNTTKDKDNTYTYFVDATSPKVDSLKVGKDATSVKTTNNQNISGDPVIGFGVSDNLTINEVTFKVTYDGVTKTKTYAKYAADASSADGATANGTVKLSDILGKKAADGDYTVTITVTDKAKNASAQKSITFKLDNSAPNIAVTATTTDKDADGKTVTVDGKKVTWVTNVMLDTIEVTSKDPDKESDIAKANYTVSGGTENNGTESLMIGTDDTTAASASGVSLPESKTTGGTKVTVNAADKSGNSVKSEYTYYIDSTSPVISGLNVNGYPAGDTGLAGLVANPKVAFNVGDNLTLSEVTIDVTYNGETITTANKKALDGTSNSYAYSLSTLLGKEGKALQDGSYTVTVNAKDKAGNIAESQTITFILDNTNPTITVTETVNGVDGTTIEPKTWVKSAQVDIEVTSGDGDQSAIDTVKSGYEIKGGTGADSITGNLKTGTDETKASVTGVKIPASASIDGTTLDVKVSDVSGNGPVTGTYTYFVDPTAPKVDSLTVKTTESGETSEDGKNLKGAPEIDFKVSDNLTLNDVKVSVTRDGKNVLDAKDLLGGAVEKDNVSKDYAPTLKELLGEDAQDGLYRVTVTVTDKAGNEASKSITFRLDNSAPTVKVTSTAKDGNGDAVSVDGSTRKWVNNVNLDIDVTSGSNDSQSDIAEATYEITGGTKGNKKADLTIDNTKASATITGLPESSSTDGTKVTVYAKDASGNDVTKTYTYYVDPDAPVIGNLTVDEKTTNDRRIAENPKIAFTVSDKLTLDKVEVWVSYNDGEAVLAKTNTTALSGGKTNAYSYSLTDLVGKADGSGYAADGDYEIIVKAWDKAGNEADSKNISFRLDNTKPTISVTATDKDGRSVNQKTWVNNVNLEINVESGEKDSRDRQSDIAEATYEIAGGTTGNGNKELTKGTDKTKASAAITGLPESSTTDGTTVTVYAKDVSGNDVTDTFTYYVDPDAPEISGLTADGKAANSIPLAKDPEIKFNVSDKLTLAEVDVAVAYNGGESEIVKKDTSGLDESKTNAYSYNLTDLVSRADGSGYAPDGDYTITITARDKAGNEADSKTITFRLDNTAPVVTASIIEGTKSDKHLNDDESDIYYSSNVTVQFTVADTNISADDLNNAVVTVDAADYIADSFSDDGTKNDLQLKWSYDEDGKCHVATVTFTEEKWHNISIKVTDKSGNVSSVNDKNKLKFDIDKTNPKISSVILNDKTYKDTTGVVYLDKTAEITFTTTDTNNDIKDFNLSVSKKLPDGKGGYLEADVTNWTVTATEKVSETRFKYTFTYDDDGEYEITAYTVDLAGNKSSEKTVEFVVDTAKPAAPTVVLQQNRGTAENPDWQTYESEYIDVDNHYQYRYMITGVKDGNGPNLDEDNVGNTVKIADGAVWSSGSRGDVVKATDGSYSYYIYTFNSTDRANIKALKDGETYQNYVVVKDRSGNEISVALTPLKKLDTSISFGEAELKNSAGVTKKFGDTNLAVNDTYKLYITVTSGNPISKDNVVLRKKGDDGAVTEFTVNSSSAFEVNDESADGRYISSLVFDIPGTLIGEGTDLNELYNNMTLYVTDNESYGNSATLGKLIYDNSRPYVSVLEYSTAAWVKAENATVTYEVVSGSNSVESILSSASYTLAGNTVDITPKNSNTTGRRSVVMPETVNPTAGTSISFTATDNSGNVLGNLNGTKPCALTMFVDGHNPEVSELTIDGLTSFSRPLAGAPTVYTAFSDNLALDRVEVTVVYPDGTSKVYTKSYGAKDGLGVDISDKYSFKLENVDGNAADGDYSVTVRAYDKAGNVSSARSLAFRVDNTNPVVDLAISGGTQGGKQPREDGTDYYYRSDVTVAFAVDEVNFTADGITVTDTLGNQAATPIEVTWSHVGDRYVAAATISAEGAHIISIGATDMTGNTAVGRSISFCIDKTAPSISLALDGLSYDESRGIVYLTADANISAVVSDMTEDAGDLNIQIIQTKPDQSAGNPSYVKTTSRSFGFTEEADYTVNFYAIDMAGNQSATRTVTFRVDKTVPELSITGAPGSGTTANETSVTFTMNEAFWWDAGGSVSIYRKAGDGVDETLFKTIELTPTAYSSSITENLTETGVYRFEFTANDQVGHTVETSQSFTIDRDAPVVTLQGVSNYDITDQSVSFMAEIMDDFYSSKSVTLYGSVTDSSGKTSSIDFGAYNKSGNPTVINREFAEDGIYDIEVTSEDAAGNSYTSKVHFTIDKTEPEIGDLSAYDGTILNAFNWDIDLDDLVSDLTVCDVHMYLNGSEYDGVSDIEDGSYTLLITAEDEMGHYVEKSVSFVLDTKAPVFIVTGVEDGEVKNEQYSIGVSLQLSEDTLEEVTLNGSTIDISDNTAELTVDSKGDYILAMKAVDEAGNEAAQQISFTYGEQKSNWWIWLIVAAGVVAAGFFIIILAKRRKKEEE